MFGKRDWKALSFRLGIPAVCMAAHAVLFARLYHTIGTAAAMLNVAPAIAFGLSFGVWGGPAFGLIAYPLNILLFKSVGDPFSQNILANLVSDAALTLASTGLGWVRDLNLRVRRQAAELQEEHRLLQEEMERRRIAEDKLAHEATHDSLTNLPNRRFFLDMLARALARAKRNPSVLCAVLYLDLDKFKMTNDKYGHNAGDNLLVQVAKRLRSAIREGDTVARMGGDEFALLLENVIDRRCVLAVARRISDRLSDPYELPAATQTTGVSIGCVIDISRYKEIDDIMADADAAMYRAKANGPSIQEAAR